MRIYSVGWMGKAMGAVRPYPSLKIAWARINAGKSLLTQETIGRGVAALQNLEQVAPASCRLCCGHGTNSVRPSRPERRTRKELRPARLCGLVAGLSRRAFQFQSAWRYSSGIPLRVRAR